MILYLQAIAQYHLTSISGKKIKIINKLNDTLQDFTQNSYESNQKTWNHITKMQSNNKVETVQRNQLQWLS